MWATLRIVFRNPKYTLIASGVGLMVFSVAVWLASIAILCGFYAALFVYYLTQRKTKRDSMKSTSWLGIGGIASGFFGVGCAACGTFLLASLATAGTAGAIILWL